MCHARPGKACAIPGQDCCSWRGPPPPRGSRTSSASLRVWAAPRTPRRWRRSRGVTASSFRPPVSRPRPTSPGLVRGRGLPAPLHGGAQGGMSPPVGGWSRCPGLSRPSPQLGIPRQGSRGPRPREGDPPAQGRYQAGRRAADATTGREEAEGKEARRHRRLRRALPLPLRRPRALRHSNSLTAAGEGNGLAEEARRLLAGEAEGTVAADEDA